MQETIFNPLGMQDTGFYVLINKIDRLSQIYPVDKSILGGIDFLNGPEIHSAGGE
jgi:CubicO group peptidase (beta-lactamase class C family)